MNRRSANDILTRLRNGRMYDREGIIQITRNLASCKISKLIDPPDCEDSTCDEWCPNLLDTIGESDPNISYLHVIRRIAALAAEGTIDHECLLYLSSLSFLSRKAAGAYMNIALVDLLDAAGMTDRYYPFFKQDVELFRELKGKEPTVRDVLHDSFEVFCVFDEHERIDPARIVIFMPFSEDLTKPFFRTGKDRMPHVSVISWTWILMVDLPARIISANAKGE